MKTYSFKKGFAKFGISALAVVAALLAFTGFSDMTLWDLCVKYLQPVLGSLTVGGLFAMASNYIKFKIQNQDNS